MPKDQSSSIATSILETYFFEDESLGLRKWEAEISASILSGDKQLTSSLCKFLYEYNEFFGKSREIQDVLDAYFAYRRFYDREWDGIDAQISEIMESSTPRAVDLSNFIMGLVHLYRGELDSATYLLGNFIRRSDDLGVLWWQALIEYCEAMRMSGYLISALDKLKEVNVEDVPSLLQSDFLLTKGLILSTVGRISDAENVYQLLYDKTKNEGDYYRYYRAKYYHSESLRLGGGYVEAARIAMEAESGLNDFDIYRSALASRYRACAQYFMNVEESSQSILHALEIFRSVGSNTSIAIATKIEGVIAHSLGDHDHSKNCLEMAKELLGESQCKYELFKVGALSFVLNNEEDKYLEYVLLHNNEEYQAVWVSLVGNGFPKCEQSKRKCINIAM